MRLNIFPSDKGDCLLLTSADNKKVLIDGGMRASYSQFVAAQLPRLARNGLDLVYVSHIDSDHIGGILQLMDDLVAWRRYDYQVANNNPSYPMPQAPRPPRPKVIWHNAFKDQTQDNKGLIEEQLVANLSILSADPQVIGEDLLDLRETTGDLVTSVREGLLLSSRVSAKQLGIQVNPQFNGETIFAEKAATPIPLGRMQIQVIGPLKADLEKLRDEWNDWLDRNQKTVKHIRKEMEDDPAFAYMTEGMKLLSYIRSFANALGNRGLVTTPNLASLMLYVKEGKKTLLLTGDGHYRDILEGLKQRGLLDADGKLHVNVLKVQHHGSEHNAHQDFTRRITADHYIFCGNGAHNNPDLNVVDMMIAEHLLHGPTSPFKFWFNSSVKKAGNEKNAEHMRKLVALLENAARAVPDRFSYRLLDRPNLSLRI
ncbi:MAG: MBL fold metallo-hydrolase [Anaerolineaceae bacterium]|nr:MBL fold metallo-hydrolase [Anaerolineaceae bacterium]